MIEMGITQVFSELFQRDIATQNCCVRLIQSVAGHKGIDRLSILRIELIIQSLGGATKLSRQFVQGGEFSLTGDELLIDCLGTSS